MSAISATSTIRSTPVLSPLATTTIASMPNCRHRGVSDGLRSRSSAGHDEKSDRPGDSIDHAGTVEHPTTAALESGIDHVRRSPADAGRLDLIARRPEVGAREVLEEATFDCLEGLVGDNWRARGSRQTADGSADQDRQLTLMSSRAIALFAGARDRWPLAGDQLYVDLDLGEANLPAGTVLHLGTATIAITAAAHTGCKRFSARFGIDAARYVNTPIGRELRLRGVNARVVVAGTARLGDVIRRNA